MEDMYPTISEQDERDILTRFLTWLLEVEDSETFIFVTEGGLRSRFVEMTTEQEVKDLVLKYLDYQLDQGAKAAEQAYERRLEH